MPTGTQPPLTGDVAALAARLDGLSPDQDPEDLSRTLRIAFEERELYKHYLSSLDGDVKRAKALLEVFDKALTAPKYDAKIFKNFRQVCGRTGLLPYSHILPEKLIQTSEVPLASGSYGDVWEGIYNDKRVAIKALRIYKDDDVRKVAKVFCKEVVIWRRISHPNIVPFLGVSEAPAPLSMVSEWMSNGNVRDCVSKNPEMSRLQLLLDITHGLSFLHSLEIVHGDLKGDDVLVDGSGRARLNDFGFTSIASLKYTEPSVSVLKRPYRWMAPELFCVINEGGSGLCTCESDVFALGMVTFEVFTGQVPFPESKASPIVIKKISDGERPSRPKKGEDLGLSNGLWRIIQSSLAHRAEERPSISVFVDFLEEATPDIAMLEQLAKFDANSEEHIQNLFHMFECRDNTLFGMREQETLVAIEVFDRVLNSSLDDPVPRTRCLHGLQKVSARCGLLPKSYWISHSSLAESDDAPSGIGMVSKAHQRSVDGRLVVVKAVSPDCIENFDAFKRRMCANAVMWKRLRHPNVVDFVGFSSDSPFSLVYPWISNGNLSEYVHKHPDADKLGLILGVARGLTHLHQYNIVHGNLTGRNILVDSNGIPRISEYGLEIHLRDRTSSKSIPTNVRWMAPEVLSTEKKTERVQSVEDGKPTDVYSFAVVMYEVLSGTSPFPKDSDKEVVGKVTIGMRPEWPPGEISEGLGGTLYGQIEACWSHDPEERPTAFKMQRFLRELGEETPQESLEPPERSNEGGLDCVEGDSESRQPAAQELIDTMDEGSALRNHAGPDKERLKLFNKLCKTCSRERLLPRSMYIPDRSWESIGGDRYGGHATVSRCTYEGRRVAVKVPNLYLTSDFDKILSRFCREAVAWKHLQHPNILPLLGVAVGERRFAMVSEWMEDGNINDFIQKYSKVNRTELLVDVAKGLAYMHSRHLVHGDLKGANILINKDRRACISDFGLSTITGVRARATATGSLSSLFSNDSVVSFTSGGTVRWTSPELLYPERFGIPSSAGDRPTRESDCYALGMVIYEVLCGRAPYHDLSGNERVILAVMEGVRPKKPENAIRLGFTEAIWNITKQCWLEDLRARPGVDDILSCLNGVPPSWHARGRLSVRRAITTLFGDSR